MRTNRPTPTPLNNATRAFTLLEVVLAAAIASIVVMGTLAGFLAVQRVDETLAARFDQANDMARLQKVMQRTFSTLVVAPAMPDDDTAEQFTTDEETGSTPASATQPLAASDQEGNIQTVDLSAQLTSRPRLLLETDTDPTIASMVNLASYKAGGSGSSIASPQRLEVVLSAPPIAASTAQTGVWSNVLASVDDAANEEASPYAGVRGAFILRPDDPSSHQVVARSARQDDRLGWSLWWQPLDSRSQPTRIASGLSTCHFQAYYKRQMNDALTTWTADQLPSYMQLEVQTLSGFYANYLFEIVWTVDDLADQQAQDQADTQTAASDNQNATIQGNGNATGSARNNNINTPRRGRAKPGTLQGIRPGARQNARPSRSQRPNRPTGPNAGPGNTNRPAGTNTFRGAQP